MRFQPSSHYRLSLLLIGFYILLMPMLVAAQDEPPAPEFLFRNGNRLVLVNGYTGQTTELPFEVADQDRFEWSPDGKYLLAMFQDGEGFIYCLNLYEIDADRWVSNEGISCGVEDTLFSSEGSQIIYSTIHENNAILWRYNLKDEQSQELYRTTDGNEITPVSISQLQWSPMKTYLTFSEYYEIMGGVLNIFRVMDMETLNTIKVRASDPYYASYNPIWSPDDSWFLIVLRDEYFQSNHKGDVYLINTETGDQYRLTYTPANYEQDVRWTEDGNIAFTVIAEQPLIFTPEQAMNVEPIPPDEIIMPGEVISLGYYDPFSDTMISADKSLGAWVTSSSTQESVQIYQLNIGGLSGYSTAVFSMPIPGTYKHQNILIGWRPSDYPYLQD